MARPASLVTRLVAAAFFLDLVTVFLVFAWGNSYLLHTLHAPAGSPGWALAIYGVVKLLSAPAGGVLVERFGMRNLLISAGGLELGGLAIGSASGTTAGFIACVGILSAGVAMCWFLLYFRLSQLTSRDSRSPAAALLGLAAGMASGGGLALAAVLTISGPARAAFYVAAGLIGCQLVLQASSMDGSAPRPAPGTRRRRPWRELVAGVRAPLAVTLFGHYAIVSTLLAVVIAYLLRALDLQLTEVALLLAPAAAMAALALAWAGKQHGESLGIAPALYGTAALATIALAATSSPWVAAVALMPLVGGIAAATPLINAAVLDAAGGTLPGGHRLGWCMFAEGAGAVAGAAAAAAIVDGLGIVAGARLAAVGLAALAGWGLIAARRRWV